MPKVPVPPLGSSLQVVGALVTLTCLAAIIGLVWTGLLVGPAVFVAGVFIESPALLGRLLQRRARPTGGG